MKIHRIYLFISVKLCCALLLFGCKQAQEHKQTAIEKIKGILQSDFEAHIQKNAVQLVSFFSDSLVDVNKGKISFLDSAKGHSLFQSYFDKVNFIKWEDEQPPIIRFSKDSSVAYAIVKKLVVLELKDKPGINDTTNFAWTSIYKRNENEYKLDCITSTIRQ